MACDEGVMCSQGLMPRWVWKIAVLAAVVFLVPFYILPFYAHPTADDYTYAASTVNAGFWDAQWTWYETWSGRYFSTMILSGFPLLVDMTKYYGLWAAFILITTPLAMWGLVREVLAGRACRQTVAIVAIGLWILFLSGMTSVVQGIYWLSGSATYMTEAMLLMVLITLGIRACRGGARAWWLAMPGALLTVMIVGCNETVMPLLILAGLVVSGVLIRFRRPGKAFWITITIMAIICSAVVILSPGNDVRGGRSLYAHQFFRTISGTVGTGTRETLTWLTASAILSATLLMVMVADRLPPLPDWLACRRKRAFLMACGITLLMVWLHELPSFWARGLQPPDRVVNAAYLCFLLGWAVTTWIGAGLMDSGLIRKGVPCGAVMVALVCSVLLQGNLHNVMRSAGKKGRQYHREVQKRYARIARAKEAGVRDLVLPPLMRHPGSIYFGDIEPNAAYWRNRDMASYFGFASVVTGVCPEDEAQSSSPETPVVSPSTEAEGATSDPESGRE